MQHRRTGQDQDGRCAQKLANNHPICYYLFARECFPHRARTKLQIESVYEMQGLTRITKVVRRFKAKEQPTDFAYWQKMPYQARLRALEDIRCEYHHWKYDAEPRLQRIYSVTKR